MKKTFVKSIFARLFLLLTIITVASCGDDVTNNYYQQPETSQPAEEEKEPTPEYELGEWIQDVYSLGYYGFYYDTAYSLYPGWILQASAVKRAYFDSPFVQEFVSDDLALLIKNPGEGVRITINTEESKINHASTMEYVVKAEDTDEVLNMLLPIKWNEEALLNWDTDQMISMYWTVQLDGQEVQQYSQTFNCRSLRCFSTFSTIYKNDAPEIIEFINELGYGSYVIQEDEDYLYFSNFPFIMGYIDENSPLIDKMKREVIDDGLMDQMSSVGSSDNQSQLDCSAYAFSYLLLKHQVKYSVRFANEMQYVRNIEEIFDNKQGYCMELAIAFASWCMNQGIYCSLELLPAHMTNRIIIGETYYPIDMTVFASNSFDFDYSIPLSSEDIENFRSIYNQVVEYSVQNDEQIYTPDREDNKLFYSTLIPSMLRYYLPSFNISSRSYIQSRVSAPSDNFKPIINNAWKKVASKILQKKDK